MKTIRVLLAIAALTFFTCARVGAHVDMGSGYMQLEHADFIVSDGAVTWAISRIYNSNSVYHGIFGNGWESKYEEYLQFLQGGVLVNEYGGGAQNYFTESSSSQYLSPDTSRLVMYDEAELGDVAGFSESIAMSSRLDDSSTMVRTLRDLDQYGFRLAQTAPAVGSRYQSNRFGRESIARYIDGYERAASDGTREYYGLDGHLRRVTFASGDYLSVLTDSAGRIFSLADSKDRVLKFTYRNGAVARISGAGKSDMRYVVSPSRALTDAYAADGTHWSYAYDRYGDMVHFSKNGKLMESYEYAADGDVKRAYRPDGTATTFQFSGSNAGGVASLTSNGVFQAKGTYDDKGRLSKLERPNKPTVEVTSYNDDGLATSLKAGTMSGTIEWYPEPDSEGQYWVKQITIPGVGTATYDRTAKRWVGTAAEGAHALALLRGEVSRVSIRLASRDMDAFGP